MIESDIHPSVLRNHRPLGIVLERFIRPTSTVLEIGAGDGGHLALLHDRLPFARWLATELPERLPALAQRLAGLGDARIAAPRAYEAGADPVELGKFDVVLTVNTFHIMTSGALSHLIASLPARLQPGACFIVYGPFAVAGEHISPGNTEFDQALRERGTGQGIRDLDIVRQRAAAVGLVLAWKFAMPANNLVLVFRLA
ncbi:MAG: DUF938 domain-containing protein [Pseudomonadota bacterium]